MSTPGRLEIERTSGKLHDPADPSKIKYDDPFPVREGGWGSGAMKGVVMHTEVGNEPGTDSWFENQQAHASAFFGVAQDGQITQFGPVGKGWVAWAQAAGNQAWYSIEHADNGHPENPLTPQQVASSAQLLEFLSRFAGFPLQVTDSVDGRGYICHGAGGVAWGNHPDCPGHVRSEQRAAVVALAKEIRVGVPAAPNPPPPLPPVHEVEGILVVLPGGVSRKVLSKDGGKNWA